MSLRVKVKERFGKRFDDEIRFFRGMMQGPKTVGSIVPTSSITAKRMASVVDIHSGLPVLELGPGTGAITKAILGRGVRPENLVAIEYSTDFHKHLQRTYPG
ncbi:MAG: rRNA adenine N-6-methyltransferase family protein, partial [Rhizobium ruizarguesonis]